MGKRGPKPMPTAVLKLRGSRWPQRNRRREPKPARGRPVCPAWLDDQAKRVWRRLVPQLDAMGVLCKVDANALERYCKLYARWRNVSDFIDKHGDTYPVKDKDGRVLGIKRFPQSRILAELVEQLGRLEARFGLSPADRVRLVATDTPQGESKIDQLRKKFG